MGPDVADSISVDFSCRAIQDISKIAYELLSRKFFRIASTEDRSKARSFVEVERSLKRWAVVRLSNDQRTHLMNRLQFSKVRSRRQGFAIFALSVLQHGQIIIRLVATVNAFRWSRIFLQLFTTL